MPTNDEVLELLQSEYLDLLHAMQSGVAAEMQITNAHEPKHLRVGVNSALTDSGALARLLIRKGIITDIEWWTALRDEMKLQVDEYEKRLREHYGKPVRLL